MLNIYSNLHFLQYNRAPRIIQVWMRPETPTLILKKNPKKNRLNHFNYLSHHKKIGFLVQNKTIWYLFVSYLIWGGQLWPLRQPSTILGRNRRPDIHSTYMNVYVCLEWRERSSTPGCSRHSKQTSLSMEVDQGLFKANRASVNTLLFSSISMMKYVGIFSILCYSVLNLLDRLPTVSCGYITNTCPVP